VKRFEALILLLSVFAGQSHSQSSIDSLLKTKSLKVSAWKSYDDSHLKLFPTSFSDYHFLHPDSLKKIKSGEVTSITLIYSKYKLDSSFIQSKLNESRLKELKKYLPGAFKQKEIKWFFVEQQSATTPAEAEKLFHGFAIQLRDTSNGESAELAIKSIEEKMKTYRESIREETVTRLPKPCKVKRSYTFTGKFLPHSDKKEEKGIRFDSKSIWNRRPERILVRDTICPDSVTRTFYHVDPNLDSTIFEIFNRDREQWKNVVIVQDVTGSMYPYTTEVLVWLTLNDKAFNPDRFLFFNDGDHKPDRLKKIGKTGGLYPIESGNMDQVKEKIFRAMRNGNGGDAPENDIEAIMEAIAKFPDCTSIVLIADNNAPVKDISLLKNLNKPVRVVLCGAFWNIQTDYLDIARATGGSVHTIENDVTDLKKILEGQAIQIGGNTYRLLNGKFVMLSKT